MTRPRNASNKIRHLVRPDGWGLKDGSLGGIETVPIADLRPSGHNARTHTLRQIKQIASSIEEFGFTNPVLLDESNRILAGHGRVEAAKRLGWRQVPAIPITHLNETQKRAYVLADNQLAVKAGWDNAILKVELQNLIELDFDVELTGFEAGEIDIILGDSGEGSADEDTVPSVQAGLEITKLGDLWHLGDHSLLCGDSTDPRTYRLLLGGGKARFVITDPPYNVQIDGNVSGLGQVRHREFKMASGEMSAEQFTAFLRALFISLVDNSQPGTIHCIFMDWRHMDEMIRAGSGLFTELKNLCVWVKSNGGMGSFYRSRHELVFVWKSGRAPHINNFELGQFGRTRTNVWEYDGANSFGTSRAEELAMHPTVKPVQLFVDAIKDCSHRKDIVLDPFGGSGTTVIACQKTGRRARVIEIDPLYCDVIIRRWQEFAGGLAIHERSGRSFADIESAPITKGQSKKNNHDNQPLERLKRRGRSRRN
jgi:DNA modification methylase